MAAGRVQLLKVVVHVLPLTGGGVHPHLLDQVVRPALQLPGQCLALDVIVRGGLHLSQLPRALHRERDEHHRQHQRGDNIKDAHPLYPNLFQHPARFPTRIFIIFPIILYSIYRYSIQKAKSDCNFIRLAQSTNLGQDFWQDLLPPPSSAFFKSNYNITLFTNNV